MTYEEKEKYLAELQENFGDLANGPEVGQAVGYIADATRKAAEIESIAKTFGTIAQAYHPNAIELHTITRGIVATIAETVKQYEDAAKIAVEEALLSEDAHNDVESLVMYAAILDDVCGEFLSVAKRATQAAQEVSDRYKVYLRRKFTPAQEGEENDRAGD